MSDSTKLHSHSFVLDGKPIGFSVDKGYRVYSLVGIPFGMFVCEKCGYVAWGSGKQPTIWATSIIKKFEVLSCNEVLVKDIIE